MNLVTATVIKTAAGVSPIPVAGNVTVYTPIFELTNLEALGVQLKATVSSGTVDVKVELQHANVEPISEAVDDANCIEPDGFSDVITLSDQSLHMKSVAPVPAKYARFKLTGGASNPASCTVAITIARQEWIA